MTARWLALFVLVLVPGIACADENDDALELARKLTTEGAATFDTHDAKAMAAYYTDDARVALVSKDAGSSRLNTEVRDGRAAIEGLYADVFKGPRNTKSKNHVELARRIDPDVLLIYGKFQPNVDDPLRVPFFQTRVRQGDRWLIANLRLYIVLNSN